MIRIKEVSKSFDTSRVLKDVTLAIPKVGLTAIIGPNGAGKSTLLSIIGRLLRADGGRVTLEELDLASALGGVVAKRLAVLKQENHIAARLTVRDLVAFGRYPYSKGRHTYEDGIRVDRAIRYLGLEGLADRFLDEMSGGQRQRAFIAAVFCQDTDYLLLDEPLNNLDIKHAVAIMQLFSQVTHDFSRSVVVVMHDINMAAAWCDRIVVMKDGAVLQHGPPAEIMESRLLTQVYETPVAVHEIEGRLVALY